MNLMEHLKDILALIGLLTTIVLVIVLVIAVIRFIRHRNMPVRRLEFSWLGERHKIMRNEKGEEIYRHVEPKPRRQIVYDGRHYLLVEAGTGKILWDFSSPHSEQRDWI